MSSNRIIAAIRRKDMKELAETISQAACVARADGEDRETYQKFKYAAGRNLDLVLQAADAARTERNALAQSLIQPNARWDEFITKWEALKRQYATRDEKGDLKIDRSDPANPEHVFTAQNEAQFLREMAALEEEYKDAKAAREANSLEIAAALDAFDQAPVSLGFYAFPWANVPEKLTGGYLYGIRHMITDIPEWAKETPPAEPVATSEKVEGAMEPE